MLTFTQRLTCACLGLSLYAASSAASSAEVLPPTDAKDAAEVPCLCQSDIKKAIRAQAVIPRSVISNKADHRNLVGRIYRDGYRPVRYADRVYWCRVEQITGTNIRDQARCVPSANIEAEYLTNKSL